MSNTENESDRHGGVVDHEHHWVKEGPAAVRSKGGTELWIIHTCETIDCPAWKKEPLYGNHEVDGPEEEPLDKALRGFFG